MSLKTPTVRVLFMRRVAPVVLVLFGVFSLVATTYRTTGVAVAATANTVNFQARLQTAAGGIVPDGNYNVQFKLYSAASGGSPLWTETYTNSNSTGLKTINGYLTVQLGSITAFSGINWDQQLWLTMNIGGTSTGTPGWDGEMNPRLPLTAVPYAFAAGQLNTTSGSNRSSLSIQAPTGGDQTFVIQDQGAAGTYNLLTANQANANYIQLQGSTPGTAQTGNFNINGVGIASSLQAGSIDVSTNSGTLDIGATNAGTINIATGNSGANVTNTIIGSTASGSSVTINSPTLIDASNANAFQIMNNAGIANLFNVDSTITNRVTVGTTGTGGGCAGKLCVGIPVTGSGGGTSINTYTVSTVETSGGQSVIGNNIIFTDTSSAVANALTGIMVDTTSSTNTSGSITSFSSKVNSGQSGNFLQLQNGSSTVLTATNAGIIDATGYSVGGVAGANTTCTSGNVLSNIVISGGIITGGTCAANGGGVAPTLQDVYNNSGATDPQILLSGTNGGLKVRDAATTVGNIVQVQNSAGNATYFAITNSGAVAANFNATTGYSVNGTAGASVTCSSTEFLQSQVVTGGIVTGGTCAAAGVNAVGVLDAGTANANAATISGTTLYLQSASVNYAGLMNTTTQSFAGNKTFTGTVLAKGTSATQFQVQDASSNVLFTANTSAGSITFGTGSNTVVFTASGGLVASGTARHARTITLPAEYAGAVLDSVGDAACSSNNGGTMTSGIDSVNLVNYYKWASTASAQCYDVVVRVPIPSDWSSWSDTTPLSLNVYSTNTTTSTVQIHVSNTSNVVESSCNYASVTPNTNSTWSSTNSNNCVFASTTTGYVADGLMTVRIRMTGDAGSDVRIGSLTLSYNSKY